MVPRQSNPGPMSSPSPTSVPPMSKTFSQARRRFGIGVADHHLGDRFPRQNRPAVISDQQTYKVPRPRRIETGRGKTSSATSLRARRRCSFCPLLRHVPRLEIVISSLFHTRESSCRRAWEAVRCRNPIRNHPLPCSGQRRRRYCRSAGRSSCHAPCVISSANDPLASILGRLVSIMAPADRHRP